MSLNNYGKLARIWMRLGALAAVGGIVAFFHGCDNGTDRTHATGSGAEVIFGESSDAAPVDKVPVSGNGSGSGSGSGKGTGGGSQLTGKSLEQCTDEKKAWRAVVDSGKSPSECTEDLVAWCCTRAEVLARFPTAAAKLDAEFARYIDGENHVLYHCSSDGNSRTTFHMAKIEGARVYYRTLYIEKSFPVDTGNKGSCPVVTTKQLSSASNQADTADKDDDADTVTVEDE